MGKTESETNRSPLVSSLRAPRRHVPIGVGIAVATVASIWHALADRNAAAATWPSVEWWLGQTLRGPGFLLEIYGGRPGSAGAVSTVLVWLANAVFYALAAATAQTLATLNRDEPVPLWLAYAVPAVLLGAGVYEQEIVWVCDAGNDLMSRPPVGLYLNFTLALPAALFLAPFASGYFGPGQMLGLNACAALMYGVVAHLALVRRRPALLFSLIGITAATIAISVGILWWTR